jgi:hypothetical protein
MICSIFKLLFWRLDFLLFLFLYQDKKRKIKFARKLINCVKSGSLFFFFLDKKERKNQGSVKIG